MDTLSRLNLSDSTSENGTETPVVPVLPGEVLLQTLEYLDDVQDFANLSMSCTEFRELIYACDACWEQAFIRDFNEMNAEDYSSLDTWRQKYIACTLDTTCWEYRSATRRYDDLLNMRDDYERRIEEFNVSEVDQNRSVLKTQLIANAASNDERITLAEESIDRLRKKRESLHLATNYRPTMR